MKLMSKVSNWLFIFFGLSFFMIIGCARKIKQSDTDTFVVKNDTVFILEAIDLNNKTISYKNKVLKFSATGIIKNGFIDGENVEISALDQKIFEDVALIGNWNSKLVLLEWFLGSDFTNPFENFDVIKQYVEVNASIYLHRMIPIAAREMNDQISGKNIIIQGRLKEKCGLILETKHGNLFKSYFGSALGFNIQFKNITLVTRDFLMGKTTDMSAEYQFSSSYYQQQLNPNAKPSIDFIVIDHCRIQGNVAIASYGAHSDNQTIQEFGTRNKISKLFIKNSSFEQINTPFSFSNMGYDTILISDNRIENFSEAFLAIPESGINENYYESLRRNKRYIEFRNNTFENTRVMYTSSERSLTPCVVKGGYGTMYFVGNNLKNLLSSNPAADVNTIYYTCALPGRCIFSNNVVSNVVGRGGTSNVACIIKDRGSKHLTIENNNISLDKEALSKIGVLKNKNDDLSKIEGQHFLCTFIQIGNQTDFTKTLVFKNNTIKLPFINMSTEIYDIADLLFEDNHIEVEYFGPSFVKNAVSQDGVFFLGRQRLDKLPEHKLGNFIIRGNNISFKKVGSHTLKFIHFPDGVQTGNINHTDLNFNYKNVEFNNVFQINETSLSIGLPDGENQVFDIDINGKSNNFVIDDATGSNHLRPNAKKYQSTIKFNQYNNRSEGSPFALIPGSNQKINIQNHDGTDIALLEYNYLTSLYNLSQEENLICYFEMEWTTNKETKKSHFYIYLNNKSRTVSIENQGKRWVEMDPTNFKQKPEEFSQKLQKGNRDNRDPKPVFYPGDRHLKNALLALTNCKEVEDIKISLQVITAGLSKMDASLLNKKIMEFSGDKQ